MGIAIALLAIFGVTILFWRLDGTVMWRDETTTAVWARTMVEQGSLVPKVFDGKTLAAQGFDAHDFNRSLTPGMQGWMQFYVTAISFKLFGADTYTARLPFAVLGLVAAGVMGLIGRRLYGNSLYALVFPGLAIASIWYLNMFRQSRYYGLVYLFSALIFYEFVRYLQNRELVSRFSWYLRIALWSAGAYSSHYLGFAGLYAALCAFVLLLGDRQLLKRWSLMTAVLVVVFGAEFFSFHFDFASSWGAAAQPWESSTKTLMDRVIGGRNLNEEELMRMVPFLFLVPGLFYLVGRSRGVYEGTIPMAPIWLSVACGVLIAFFRGTEPFPYLAGAMFLVVAVSIFRYWRQSSQQGTKDLGERVTAHMMLGWFLPALIGAVLVMGLAVAHTPQNLVICLSTEFLVAGLLVFGAWKLRAREGSPISTQNGVILLGMLTIVVSVVVIVAIGLDKAYPRYYFQVLMASNVLAALVATEFLRWRRKAGLVALVVFLIWPNLSFYIPASNSVVERQLTASQVVDAPAVRFVQENVQAGDRMVVYRNVQGMMLHFYKPDAEWRGQLSADNQAALSYRDLLPDTAYDTVGDVDWYLVWHNFGVTPKGLDDRYELVWEYEYNYPMSWWEQTRGSKDQRFWKFYKRKDLARGKYPATASAEEVAAMGAAKAAQ